MLYMHIYGFKLQQYLDSILQIGVKLTNRIYMVSSNQNTTQPEGNHPQETQQPASLNKRMKSHRNKNLCH
jgi:hypothetical protein